MKLPSFRDNVNAGIITVTSGIEGGNNLYLFSFYPDKCICYTYIIMADSEEDAKNKIKLNLINFITEFDIQKKKYLESDDRNSMYNFYLKTKKQEEILECLEDKNKYKIELIDNNRAIPVAYFDDWRSNV